RINTYTSVASKRLYLPLESTLMKKGGEGVSRQVLRVTMSSASMLVTNRSLLPMTANSKIEEAWNYHNATKHSYASVRNNLHYLDWANQPLPFKAYTAPEPLPLPREVRQSGVAALSAIAE